jgi:uncharacterized membrane protein
MLKPIAMLAAAGFVGVFLTRLLGFLLLPLVGMFIGFVLLVLKIVLIVGLIWLGFSLFRKWTDRPSEA